MSQLIVRVGGMMGAPIVIGSPASFIPTDLGASLFAWWSADRLDLITQVAGAVSSWRDIVAAYDAAQGAGTAQPIYAATSWGGVSPGITFDGTNDRLDMATQPFPSGATPSEIWAIVDQTALVADATTRCVASYGGTSATDQRRLHRRVVTGANVVTSAVNTSNADAPGSFSGRHAARGIFSATTIQAAMDGTAGSTAAGVPATGTTRLRIGATASTTPANFFQGVIRHILVTGSLSAGQVTSMNTWAAGQL